LYQSPQDYFTLFLSMQFITPTSSFLETAVKQFKVVTWNVWFDEFEQKTRYTEILRVCAEQQPDIMCFQEVTVNFLQILHSWEFLHLYQFSNDPLLYQPGQYGVLTLAKREYCPEFAFYPFPTNMGRKLLVTRLLVNSQQNVISPTSSVASMATMTTNSTRASPFPSPDQAIAIYIGNVHLESLEYHHVREQQLAICARILSQYPYYFLCGDFNFCSYRNRAYCFQNTDQGEMKYCPSPKGCKLHNLSLHEILPEIKDLWASLRPGEAGYTFDGTVNEYCDRRESMRYDRICFSFPGNDTRGSISASMSYSGDENQEPIIYSRHQGNIIPSSFSFDEMLGKSSNNWRTKSLLMAPKFVRILGDEPVVQRKLSDPPPMMSQQSLFVSPPPTDRPYRAIYNRKLVYVYPSDHFGVCGTFDMSFN